ncbi:hypothetical protein [Parapedobacter soli]|uniref:hypothetical protein n=1 Tax=Parapedobacter soli TaxID=416955 RepID=UPI0021C99F13|nr:hypothetical protein [Parapedobacter soli]
MEAVGKLSNAQLELLKLFKYDLSGKQLAEMKNMLSKYFADTASDEMDQLWEKNNWSNDTMKEWSNGHERKRK